MTSGYYCAIFPFCGGGKKKDDKKTKAFYDWATTGIPVTSVSSFRTAVQPCLTGRFFDSKVMPRTASSFLHETPKIISNHHLSSHAVELSFKTQTQRSTLIYFTCVIPLYSA